LLTAEGDVLRELQDSNVVLDGDVVVGLVHELYSRVHEHPARLQHCVPESVAQYHLEARVPENQK